MRKLWQTENHRVRTEFDEDVNRGFCSLLLALFIDGIGLFSRWLGLW